MPVATPPTARIRAQGGQATVTQTSSWGSAIYYFPTIGSRVPDLEGQGLRGVSSKGTFSVVSTAIARMHFLGNTSSLLLS